MDDISQFADLFFESANQHIFKLNQLLQNIENDNSAVVLAELHLHLHSLKGEVYTMQYPLFGKYITITERYLKSLIDTNRLVPDEKFALLRSAIFEIQTVIEVLHVDRKEPVDLENKTKFLQESFGIIE